MRTKKMSRPALAVAALATTAGAVVAAPVPAHALTPTRALAVAVAPDSGTSIAAKAIVIGSIETDDCTYTLVLDWDGFHIEVTCVSIS